MERLPSYPGPVLSDISEPPSLQYELRDKKLKIGFFASMVLLDSMIIPIVLYFVLWRGSGLDHNTVYNIISATLAGTCIFEYFQRMWILGKKTSVCRVNGAKWYYMDSFQYILSVSLVLVVTLVIVGGIPNNPKIRVLAMVMPAFVFMSGFELLLLDLLRLLDIKAPVRLSSIPRGGEMRPAIYLIIEDVIAVDGGGGTAFRERLNKRYEASAYFRQLLEFLTLFWSMAAILVGGSTAVLVMVTERSVGYVIGWVVPFIWAFVWVIISVKIVKAELSVEKGTWSIEVAKRQRQLRGFDIEPMRSYRRASYQSEV